MNKPITNRVRNGAWGKDAVHQPTLKTGKVESPAKQIEVVTEGEPVEKQREVIVDETTAGANLTTPDAIGGGTAGKPWENKMTELLSGGRTYEQMAAAGHGTVEGLKKRFPGYEGNTGREADVVTQVKKTETYTEPGKDTSYTPGIVHETDAITPWENRWNRRVQKQNERWGRQEARKDLRNIAKQEARNIRQEGGTWAEGWKGRRDVMTGRAELSDKEQALYNESRGISDQQTRIMDTGRSMDQLNQGASGSDKVYTKKDMDKYDASTMKGTAALEQTKKNLGGDYSRLNVVGSGSESTGSGLDARSAGRAKTNSVNSTGSKNLISAEGRFETPKLSTPDINPAASASLASGKSAGSAETGKTKVLMSPDLNAPTDKNIANQIKAVEMGEAAAKGQGLTNSPKGSISDAGTGAAASGETAPRKTWKDRAQSVVDNAKAKRAERQETKEEMKAGQTVINAPRKTASIDIKESAAPTLRPTNMQKPDYKGVNGTGMSTQEISDLSEALTEQKNAKVVAANKNTATNIQANTGTAPRSSYNRTSAPLVDGTPTLDKKDRQSNSLVSAAQMRYQSNVGMKGKSPLKKGYFK
jgi:hypothetical protein